MNVTQKLIKKQRKFSEDFKRSLIKEFESGKYSVPQLSRIHRISNSLIYGWVYKYSTFNEKGFRIVEMKESSSSKLKALEQKVKDLERTVGQKQIMIDYLEKMMDIAKEELNIDIKKNLNTLQSGGFEKTKKR